jgi:predicted LPLAT superfamily acyltransferase
VVFFAGLYCCGNRYRIIVEQLADFSDTATSGREAAIRGHRPYDMLENLCRSHPYNGLTF